MYLADLVPQVLSLALAAGVTPVSKRADLRHMIEPMFEHEYYVAVPVQHETCPIQSEVEHRFAATGDATFTEIVGLIAISLL